MFGLLLVICIKILFRTIFIPVIGDETDLFSSTEDMKRLFLKEEEMQGKISNLIIMWTEVCKAGLLISGRPIYLTFYGTHIS